MGSTVVPLSFNSAMNASTSGLLRSSLPPSLPYRLKRICWRVSSRSPARKFRNTMLMCWISSQPARTADRLKPQPIAEQTDTEIDAGFTSAFEREVVKHFPVRRVWRRIISNLARPERLTRHLSRNVARHPRIFRGSRISFLESDRASVQADGSPGSRADHRRFVQSAPCPEWRSN